MTFACFFTHDQLLASDAGLQRAVICQNLKHFAGLCTRTNGNESSDLDHSLPDLFFPPSHTYRASEFLINRWDPLTPPVEDILYGAV